MADLSLTTKALRQTITSTSAASKFGTVAASPGLATLKIPPRVFLPPIPTPPAPAPPAPAPPVPVPTPPVAALPTLPPVPDENPFNHLPFPAPGDRIRADDFKQLSLCLQLMQSSAQLSAALFGQSLAAARPFLAAQGRVLARVMSVFGAVLQDPNDTSFDQRIIMMVLPVIIGEPEVQVIVSEAVETRRLAPSLVGFNYDSALNALRASVGQGTIPSSPSRVPTVTNMSLGDAIASVLAPTSTGRTL